MWLSNSVAPFVFPSLHPNHLVALNSGGILLLDAMRALDRQSSCPRNGPLTTHDLFGHVIIADSDGRILATSPTAPQSPNQPPFTTPPPAVKTTVDELKRIQQSFNDDWSTKGMITIEGRKHVFINSIPTSCRAGQPEFLQNQMFTFMLGARMPFGTEPGQCCIPMLSNDLLFEIFKHLKDSVNYPKIAVGAARGTIVGLIVGVTRRCIVVGVYPQSMCPEPYLSCAMSQLAPFMDAIVECGW
eukprot:c12162_g2_i1.p1 GENE.c12162_g2_i1~~c12162_g2_i1.p1  ORF type:complete len:243 (+),score=48.83 c12162_g2_i1:201-929(+)